MGRTDEEVREEFRQTIREFRQTWRLSPEEERYYQLRGECERLIETLPLDRVPERCVRFIR